MKFNVLTAQGIKDIHDVALGMLETIGMDIGGDGAQRLLLEAGATEKGGRICFGHDLVTDALSKVPADGFAVAGRDGGHSFRVMPGACRVRPAGGPPFVYDPQTQRRRQATMDDVARIATVCDALDGIDVANGAASPADVRRTCVVRRPPQRLTRTSRPMSSMLRIAREKTAESDGVVGRISQRARS